MGCRSETSALTTPGKSSHGVFLKAVIGLVLCLTLSSARPVSHTVLGQFDPLSEADETEEALSSVLANLPSLLNEHALQSETSSADDYGDLENLSTDKRGFGIAGLDNVDMITSTLDRSRSMSRARPGRRYLSSGLTFKQLRALMERAG